MTRISIIGAGKMGRAIAAVCEKGGNVVELIDLADVYGPIAGEIVILAVPYSALADVFTARGTQLDGKIVVDITNPVDFETFDSLMVAADSSATAEIAAALPNSRVLKAFNTTFQASLLAGNIGDQPTTVLIAGDDAKAKLVMARVVTAAGLRAIDVGSLRRARELEAFGFLQITLADNQKISGFAVIV